MIIRLVLVDAGIGDRGEVVEEDYDVRKAVSEWLLREECRLEGSASMWLLYAGPLEDLLASKSPGCWGKV